MNELSLKTNLTIGKFELTNFDELKEEVEKVAKKYSTIIISENDIKEMTEVKAKLNKVAKQFNDFRISKEKEYKQGFIEAENQIKELCSLIKNASENINNQLQHFEAENNSKKLVEVEKIYQELLTKNQTAPKFLQIFKEQYYNKGFTFQKIELDMQASIDFYNNQIELLNNISTDKKFKDEVLFEYNKHFDLNNASLLTTIIKEVKERQDSLKNEKVEENVNLKVYSLTLEVATTKPKLDLLATFLKDNNINFKFKENK